MRTRNLLSTMQRQDVIDRYNPTPPIKKRNKSQKYMHIFPPILYLINQLSRGRLIIIIGFVLFSLAVLYVVSKRIGLLKLQRKIIEAVKTGTVKDVEFVPRAGRDGGVNLPEVNRAVPGLDAQLEQAVRDEL